MQIEKCWYDRVKGDYMWDEFKLEQQRQENSNIDAQDIKMFTCAYKYPSSNRNLPKDTIFTLFWYRDSAMEHKLSSIWIPFVTQ